MTTPELLRFAGGVLGPALVAQALADLLRAAPELQPPPAAPPGAPDAERLLRQVFPRGLDL